MTDADALLVTGESALRERGQARVTWTPTFIAYLGYLFIIVTYKFGVATVMMVVALASLFLDSDRVRIPKFLWWLAAWVVWAAIGFVTTRYPDVVWEGVIQHCKILVVGVVAVNALRTKTQIRYFMLVVLVSFLLFPVRATVVSYLQGHRIMGRAAGPFIYENPNDLAAITILMLAPALALWAGEPRRSPVRWIGLACVVPLVVTILLTQSRGAFLALVAIVVPSGIALARRRLRLVVAFAAVIGVALSQAPAGLWQRLAGLRKATSIETIGEMDPEGSARERFAVLQTAVRIVVDHPLLGIGLGAYDRANAQYSPSLGDRDTHNTYMNIAAETGLPGLVFFLALVTTALRTARDALRRAKGAWPEEVEALRWLQYGLVGYLIAGVFGSFSSLAFPYVFLALLWSASEVLRARCPPTSSRRPAPGQPPVATIPVRPHRGWSV